MINYFLNGYKKALELIPDFNKNNLNTDWEYIGKDIFIAIDKKRKEIKKVESNSKKRD